MSENELTAAVHRALDAQEKWCDANGWDNPEYDDFVGALDEVRRLVGRPRLIDTWNVE